MRSEARTFLSRLSNVHGVNGVLVVRKGSGGDDIPPGSMAFPPCECGGEKCPDRVRGPLRRPGAARVPGAGAAEVDECGRKGQR